MRGATLPPPAAPPNNVFQSTHPCGVRLFNGSQQSAIYRGFNPRTRAGCDKLADLPKNGCRLFQSTHPCGVRQRWKEKYGLYVKFQSTHPCGVRRGCRGRNSRRKSFNPRTRAGCDNIAKSNVNASLVSIHAPVRGATIRNCCCSPWDNRFNPRTRAGCDFNMYYQVRTISVSIHAPVRGATPIRPTSSKFCPRFQSTHPCGVRQYPGLHNVPNGLVSIHAPVRGATLSRQNKSGGVLFQSTHPCGVRPIRREGYPG